MTSTGPVPTEAASLTYRIVEVAGASEEDADGTLFRGRMLAAVTGAHAAAAPLSVAWIRTKSHGPVQVLAGGTIPDNKRIGLPPGTRVRPMPAADVQSLTEGLVWAQVSTSIDASVVDEDAVAAALDDYFAYDARPGAFLVVARPVGDDVSGPIREELSDELARLEALRTGRGSHRRDLRRVEANLEYLDRAVARGCWQLSVWTAGTDLSRARSMAAALSGCADVRRTPLLIGRVEAVGPGQESAVAGPDVVAALLRPPMRELPGVRVRRLPAFDQNVEDSAWVRLGAVLDATQSPAAPFGLSAESVNRHVFVCGATGTGKSETVSALLYGLSRRGVPWLVIEPAKVEYARLGPWMSPDQPLIVIRPGDPAAPPPMVNPLEPASLVIDGQAHRFPLQTHLDMVRALFIASFEAQEPFPQVLSAGLVGAYRSKGWNLVTGEPRAGLHGRARWPVLGDLVASTLAAVERLGYGREVESNMLGFVRVRIESLRSGTPGKFFEGGYPLDVADLLTHPTVIEIEDLGDDRDKAFFIGNLLIRIVEILRLRSAAGHNPTGLAHVLVVEEAHRLLRRVAPEDPSAHAVTEFANLLAEIRAYGEGVVIAEQIPSKVITDVVKNSAVKILHRMPAEDDRAMVGATMNLTPEQSRFVVSLPPGIAAAHTPGMDNPVLVGVESIHLQPTTGAGRGRLALGARSAPSPGLTAPDLFTLAELEHARDLLRPEVLLWVETAVVAHLTWDPIGTPRGAWFNRLRTSPDSLLSCAIGLGVHEAVAHRDSLLTEWYDALDLEVEISRRLLAQVGNGRGLARPPWRWAVGQFRLRPMKAALTSVMPGADAKVPHPDTPRWASHGVEIPGPDLTAQLAQLEQLAQLMPRVRPADLLGTSRTVDAVVRELGSPGRTPARRLVAAQVELGLDHRWMWARLGVADD